MPTVSVVVTTYNREALLKETLLSILAQTYTDFELIVVDNHSNYDFNAMINGLNDPRLRSFSNANDGVIAVNRNYGIERATGKYIALCDDDDLWEADKLRQQVDYLERHPKVALVCTASSFINGPVKSGLRKFTSAALRAFLSLQLPAKYTLLGAAFVTNSSVLFRKEVTDRIGKIDETPELRAVEDYDYWFRISQQYPIAYLDKELVRYRFHAAQVSDESLATTKKKMIAVMDKHWPDMNGFQKKLFTFFHKR